MVNHSRNFRIVEEGHVFNTQYIHIGNLIGIFEEFKDKGYTHVLLETGAKVVFSKTEIESDVEYNSRLERELAEEGIRYKRKYLETLLSKIKDQLQKLDTFEKALYRNNTLPK